MKMTTKKQSHLKKLKLLIETKKEKKRGGGTQKDYKKSYCNSLLTLPVQLSSFQSSGDRVSFQAEMLKIFN